MHQALVTSNRLQKEVSILRGVAALSDFFTKQVFLGKKCPYLFLKICDPGNWYLTDVTLACEDTNSRLLWLLVLVSTASKRCQSCRQLVKSFKVGTLPEVVI